MLSLLMDLQLPDLLKLCRFCEQSGVVQGDDGARAKVTEIVSSKRANLNYQDFGNGNHGNSALIWVTCRGRGDLIKVLIEGGANLDLQNSQGKTALMFAALLGHLEIVRVLIRHGAKLHLQDKEGWTALTYACMWNMEYHVEIIKELVRGTCDIVSVLSEGQEKKAIFCAVRHGCVEAVQALIEVGVAIDHSNENNRTVLQEAYHTNIDLLRIIFEGVEKRGQREVAKILNHETDQMLGDFIQKFKTQSVFSSSSFSVAIEIIQREQRWRRRHSFVIFVEWFNELNELEDLLLSPKTRALLQGGPITRQIASFL